MPKFLRLLTLTVSSLVSLSAFATDYPLTVTDMAGRQVTLDHEPERVVLQDGRDLLSLAVLDKEQPFRRVVAWNNLLKHSDKGMWQQLEKQWPDSANILDMKFSDGGDMNLESVLSKKPDLVIAQLRGKPALEQSHIIATLKQVNVPVLFVDTGVHPVSGAPASMTLLGKVLNRESQAAAFTAFYKETLSDIEQRVNKAEKAGAKQPNVFIEAHAGAHGADDCCFTHADFGWGTLVKTAGGHNLGNDLLKSPTGTVAMEAVLEQQPDVYVMTGSQWGQTNAMGLPFGYNASAADVQKAFATLLARPGFSEMKAVKNAQVYGVYHQFYNHPYNVVGIQALASDFYPAAFAGVDAEHTFQTLLSTFTEIDGQGLTLFGKAQIQ